MSNLFSLEGKVVLITGASRGIGKAIATMLVAQGAKVAGTATSESGAANISDYLGDNGKGYALNVTDPASIEATLAAIKADLGDIDVLVNNAGITRDNLLMAVLRPMMKKKNGRIINIGSVVGTMGNAGQANYAAAKAGVIGFSKSLAREVASRGITVNVIAPGFIQTDMTNELTDDQKAATLANVPAGRLGQPDEIAAAVCYLASDAAAYVSGETLHVNGAMYMV